MLGKLAAEPWWKPGLAGLRPYPPRRSFAGARTGLAVRASRRRSHLVKQTVPVLRKHLEMAKRLSRNW